MAFTTLGDKTKKNRVPRKESWAMAFDFIATTETLLEGQPVKLNADGGVQGATANDFSIGMVDVGGKNVYAETGRVTILTDFMAEVFGVASGAVTTGGLVVGDGVNGTADVKFKTAVSGNWAVGIALNGGADTAGVRIGFFRMPIKIA